MPGQRRCRTRVEITYQAQSVDAIPGTAQRREPHFAGPRRERAPREAWRCAGVVKVALRAGSSDC
jgi:hypothetical protein